MKRKLIVLLCACMLIAGCGQGSGGAGGERKETMDHSALAEETGKSDRGETSGNRTMDEVLGGPTERMLAPVELKDEFQRASYLADRISEFNGENVLVSPLSLDFALGLTAQGASGETAKELYDYLGTADYADFAREYMTFAEELTRKQEENKAEKLLVSADYSFQYSIANSIWVNDQRKLLKEYQDAAEQNFRAEVDSVDFGKNVAKSVKRINAWCEEKTNGLIPQIISENALSPATAAVLINTVYFESPWVDEWRLSREEFHNLDGTVSDQEMLMDTETVYFENPYATAFGKNYYNGFRFIGILPKAEGDFQIADLDLKSLLESETTQYDVSARMPKLNYDTATKSGDIVQILKAQGVYRAFDRECAEFDKMIEMREGETAYIDDILQKCKIELDEKGTRAAAVTAVMVKCCAEALPKQVKEVHLNRPFAFLIYDSRNEKIVFIGKVVHLD